MRIRDAISVGMYRLRSSGDVELEAALFGHSRKKVGAIFRSDFWVSLFKIPRYKCKFGIKLINKR